LILQEALEAVRQLSDEAMGDPALTRESTTLSKLSSALEYAAAREAKFHVSHVLKADVVMALSDFTSSFASLLDDPAASVLLVSLPAIAPEPSNVTRIREERDQVFRLFNLAVEGKAIGDVYRSAQLLIVKSKALIRAQEDEGLLITAGEIAAVRKPLIQAAKVARDFDKEAFDSAFVKFREGQSNGK